MKLKIEADFVVDKPKSLKIIDEIDLEESRKRIYEIMGECLKGKLRSGIKYKIEFIVPTPTELKQCLVDDKLNTEQGR
ncbi:MAG: hypothetical protein AAF558_08295 [Verrucomicrobiota bacterium]